MQRIQFFSATVLSGSGLTPAFPVSDQKGGTVTLAITAVSGTSPLLAVWLQESDDGGTSWFDVTSATVQVGSATKTEGTVTTAKRNICLDANAAATYRAVYENLHSDLYRLRYDVGGTTPQFTVNATLQTK